MKHIFYFLAIFAIMWEMVSVFNTRIVHDFCKRAKSLKEVDFDNWSYSEKVFPLFMLGYATWVIIGLFSSQWFVFLLLLAFSCLPKKYIAIRFVDALISLLLLFFIVLNAYHFKIDIIDIVSYLKN